MSKYFIILLAAALVAGCGSRGTVFEPGAAVYEPTHASGFAIFEAGQGSRGSGGGQSRAIKITDPWQGAQGVEQWVLVAAAGEQPPANFTGTVLPQPARRIVCMSSSYVAFLSELGVADRIVGVSGADFITDPTVRARIATGDVADVGYDGALDYERLAALRPDLMLVYGVRSGGETGAGGATGRLAEMGVPYVFVGDYIESSPQGRAEWLVAIGAMCGLLDRAVERFTAIDATYDQLKEKATQRADSGIRPRVMMNAPYRDVWWAPGDDNYMTRLVRDAGGDYVLAGTPGADSRPVDIEQAYVAMQRADYWLGTGHYSTLAALLADNPRFAATPPVRAGRVYNTDARTTPGGGSDFWESAVVRPDRVLRDLVNILHPGEMPGEGDGAATDTTLYYYRQLP